MRSSDSAKADMMNGSEDKVNVCVWLSLSLSLSLSVPFAAVLVD